MRVRTRTYISRTFLSVAAATAAAAVAVASVVATVALAVFFSLSSSSPARPSLVFNLLV